MKKNKDKKYKKNTIKSKFKNKAHRLLKNLSQKNLYYELEYLQLNIIIKSVIKIIIIILLLIIFFVKFDLNNKTQGNSYGLSLSQKLSDYTTKKFAIFRRRECFDCGLFSFYIVHLGCIQHYLSYGYMPIADLKSFKNKFNRGNRSVDNPWELFFYQPYNYTLEEVKKYSKHYKYFQCTHSFNRPNDFKIYYQNYSLHYWHDFAKKYMPVKNDIMNEAKIIMQNFFGNSKNILGVMIRGTNYVALRPKGHSIQPTVEQVISDVKIYDKQYKYDFIFFATEDETIRNKFVPEFDNRLKILFQKDFKNINKFSENVNKKLNSVKNYVLNIVILSKCLDIITSRTSGSAGIFILTEGFRHFKVYDLGLY